MKKNLSSLFIFILVFSLFVSPVLAEDNSDAVTFFESTENLQKLHGYKMNQGISGDFKLNMGQTKEITELTGKYQLNFNGNVYNKKPYENDSDINLKGQLKFHVEGQGRQFADIIINFVGKLIIISGDGIYIKLVNAGFEATGVSEKDRQDYLDTKKEIDKNIQDVRGQWIYLPDTYAKQLNQEGVPEEFKGIADKDALIKKLQTEGIRKTYQSLFTDTLSSLKETGTITDEQDTQIQKAVDTFLSTKFFRYKTIKKGKNNGFTSFSLNKSNILNLAINLSKQFGETMDAETIGTLRSYMEKFDISGMYHTDENNRILDQFRLKFVIRNINEISHFLVNYSYKISNINNVEPIKAPTKFTSVEEMNLPFLPLPADETNGINLEY